jgi:plasmid segregation protein ParM
MDDMVVGLDIGYSNLKLAVGECGGRPRTYIRPAGVAPTSYIGDPILGTAQNNGYYAVDVEGTSYYAGIRHSLAESYPRVCNDQYPLTNEYLALYRAALLMSELPHIPLVVTGLPVNQFQDSDLRAAVVARLQGEHQIARRISITVDRVEVVAQPIGGCLTYQVDSNVDMSERKILVVDQGYFSLDWVLIQHMQIQRAASGTSTDAMSVVLQDALVEMGQDYGVVIPPEKLEHCLRSGLSSVLLRGQQVDFQPYLQKAVEKHSPTIMSRIRNSLRSVYSDMDAVVLVGGGATFFEPVFKQLDVPVYIPQSPVLANALGYWHIGRVLCSRASA